MNAQRSAKASMKLQTEEEEEEEMGSGTEEEEEGAGETTERSTSQASVYVAAAGFSISGSLLSIINKWAVMKFPYPGALTALQYFTTVSSVVVGGWLNLVDHDALQLRTMWNFFPAAVVFYLSIFTNSELLLHANIDTFIVFRSISPLFVAIGETLYLKQPWPSAKTWASLGTIFGGSVMYVMADHQFTVTAYSWAVAYLAMMCIDQVYIKHVVMTIGLNTWGLVLYNNLEALLLFPLEFLVTGEMNDMKKNHQIAGSQHFTWYSMDVVLPVALSCLFGLSISFFSFSCRRATSATGFTVLGIVNKLATVGINLLIWDKHSTWIGTLGLLVCILGGVLYQQSTANPKPPPPASPESVNEHKVGGVEVADEEKLHLVLEMEMEPVPGEGEDKLLVSETPT